MIGIPAPTSTRHTLDRRRLFRVALSMGAVGALGLQVGCDRGQTNTQALSRRGYRIGWLERTEADPERSPLAVAFRARMAELGYREGDTLTIDYRAPLLGTDLRSAATEMADQGAAALVVIGSSAAIAAGRIASRVPVVFLLDTDPVEGGLIESYSRPGRNATGLVYATGRAELAGKITDLFLSALPGLTRFGVLFQPPADQFPWRQIESSAEAHHVQLVRLPVRAEVDLDDVFASVERSGIGAIGVFVDELQSQRPGLGAVRQDVLLDNLGTVRRIATRNRLPLLDNNRAWTRDGDGLLYYGPSETGLGRRIAELVDRILRGDRAGDIPVEQPVLYELILNLRTARALGLTLPPPILAQATEVIQ